MESNKGMEQAMAMKHQEPWETVVGVLTLLGQVAEFCSQEVPAVLCVLIKFVDPLVVSALS